MAKLRLILWMALLSAATVTLLDGATWPDGGDPAVAVMAVVRLAAGVLAAYLLVATVLSVAAAVTRMRPLARLAGGVSTSVVRGIVATAVGGGLLVSPLTSAAEVSPPPQSEAPVLERLEQAPPRSVEEVGAEDEVVVGQGDHLWAIAERTLARRLGRPPTDGEIVPYWLAVIDANRDRLATIDPDLIFVGQVFRLPS